MNHESLELIEAFEKNPHLDPWTVIKDIKGWTHMIGWNADGSTNIKEVLLLLNKSREDIL